jgi:hypothetical protein
LDPQWLVALMSRIIRVYDGDLHKLDVDDKARRQTLEQWKMLVEEGKLTRGLLEILWGDLTTSAAERSTLLHLLQKFDLLLLYEENRGENEHIFLVPSMLPVEPKPTFLMSTMGRSSFWSSASSR